MRKSFWITLAFIILLIPLHLFAEGGEINTANLFDDAFKAAPHCLHYKVVGVCLWLHCSGFECSINKTLKLDHYLPDSVITVFHQDTTDPWYYAQKVIDPIAKKTGAHIIQSKYHVPMGTGDHSVNSYRDNDNRFKETDVIGNPAASIFTGNSFLPASTQPFLPYFSSMIDAYFWRSGKLEMLYPGSLIPGVHDIGTFPIDVWGNLYPRTGFVNQPDDAKAAAVIAQRAADIVTNNGPHFYIPLGQICGSHCTILATHENNPNTQFQMIYPTVEKTCSPFGKDDLVSPLPWHANDVSKGNTNYAWIMW